MSKHLNAVQVITRPLQVNATRELLVPGLLPYAMTKQFIDGTWWVKLYRVFYDRDNQDQLLIDTTSCVRSYRLCELSIVQLGYGGAPKDRYQPLSLATLELDDSLADRVTVGFYEPTFDQRFGNRQYYVKTETENKG